MGHQSGFGCLHLRVLKDITRDRYWEAGKKKSGDTFCSVWHLKDLENRQHLGKKYCQMWDREQSLSLNQEMKWRMKDELKDEAAPPPRAAACGGGGGQKKKKGTTKSVRGRKKKKIKWICSEESNPLILTKAEIQGHEKPLRWQAVFY